VFEPGTILDRYELLRPLAVGGMGEIHLARVQGVAGFGALVAIKVLAGNLSTNPAFVRMFLDEARSVARLRHEHIVQIRDLAVHQGQYYMVMEYIRGQNLRELLGDVSIRDSPLFTPRLAARLFADLASALHTVHQVGLVHRDLSPNNIMISDAGVPKLIDFGVARALGTTSLTNPGTLKGKFTYMAPEYVRGDAYDHRLDIFSLGVVMWETLTRRRLFRGTHAAEQLRQVLDAKIPRLDEIVAGFPVELADLVDRMLERDPAKRTNSAGVISEQLRELARGYTEAGDRTLHEWLARRIGPSIEARRHRDQQCIESGPNFDAPVIEVVGTPAGTSVGSGERLAPDAAVASLVPTNSTSVPSANGEAISQTSPPRSRWWGAYSIVVAGVLLAVVAGISLRRNGESAAVGRAPSVVPTRSPDMEGERHRRAGIDAIAAKDYQGAITELAEAMRHGVDDASVLQLMELARKLKHEASTRVVKTK
jgi:serine/threonine protein kinase